MDKPRLVRDRCGRIVEAPFQRCSPDQLELIGRLKQVAAGEVADRAAIADTLLGGVILLRQQRAFVADLQLLLRDVVSAAVVSGS